MKLVKVPHTTIQMLLGVRPLPDGWDAIGKYAVRDDEWDTGILVRNQKTGFYGLFSGGAMLSVDQRAAKEYAKSIEGEAEK